MRLLYYYFLFKLQAVRLSNAAFGEVTAGHIVNLMSNDVGRFDYVSYMLYYILYFTFLQIRN